MGEWSDGRRIPPNEVERKKLNSVDSIIRSALVTANSVTSSLQVTVTLQRKQASGTWGTTYGSPVSPAPTAIWEKKSQLIQTPSGQMTEAKSEITFVQPVDIDYGDKLIAPDGSTGPILRIEGLIDPRTGKPYMVQVWLG